WRWLPMTVSLRGFATPRRHSSTNTATRRWANGLRASVRPATVSSSRGRSCCGRRSKKRSPALRLGSCCDGSLQSSTSRSKSTGGDSPGSRRRGRKSQQPVDARIAICCNADREVEIRFDEADVVSADHVLVVRQLENGDAAWKVRRPQHEANTAWVRMLIGYHDVAAGRRRIDAVLD